MFGLVGGLNKIIVSSREIIKDSAMINVKVEMVLILTGIYTDSPRG